MIRAPKKRGSAKKWTLFVCTVVAVFLFRKTLLLGAVQVVLGLSLSNKTSTFTYEKIQWEKDVIRMDDISFANNDAEIRIDQINIAFSGKLFSWNIYCKLFHPEITVKAGGSSCPAPLHFLVAPHCVPCSKVFLEIHDGVVHLDENPPLYFSFLPSPQENHKGRIALSYEPQYENSPLFTALIEEKEDVLGIDFSLIEEDCSRLLPIAIALFPKLPKEWEQTSGKVEASGQVFIDQMGGVTGLSCCWNADQLALASASSGIEILASHLYGSLSSDVLLSWDQLWLKGKGRLLFQELEFHVSSLMPYQFSLQECELVLEPDQEPYFSLNGVCKDGDAQLPFTLQASGELHADAAFFLKLEGKSACTLGNDMRFEGSLCRFEEKKYAAQLQFNDVLFEHLDFFSKYLPPFWSRDHWTKDASDIATTLIWENQNLQADIELLSNGEKVSAHALFDETVQLKEGWFESEKMTEQSYSPLLKLLDKHIAFTGAVQVKGNFDPSILVLSLQGSDCVLHHAYGDLFMPAFGENGVELIYHVKEKKWEGEIPLIDAKWSSRNPHYDIASIRASLHLRGKTLHIPSFSARYKDTFFQGKLGACQFEPMALSLELEKFLLQWSLQDGSVLQWDIPECTIQDGQNGISARFHAFLHRDQKRILELAGSAEPSQNHWDITWDQKRTRFLNTHLNISRCHFSLEKGIAVQMQPELLCEELLEDITWLSQAGLVSFPIDKFKEWACRGELRLTLSTENLSQSSHSSSLHFKCESKDLSVRGNKWAPFTLQGNKLGEHLEIKECRGEGFVFKACADVTQESIKLTDLEGQFKGVALKAAGDLDLTTYFFRLSVDSIKGNLSALLPANPFSSSFTANGSLQGALSSPFSIQGEAVCTLEISKPLAVTAWNVKPLKLSYTQDSGLCVKDLSAYLKSKKEGVVFGQISLGQCTLPLQKESIETTACSFSIHSFFLKECAEAHLLPAIFKESLLLDKLPDKIEGALEFQMGREGVVCRAAVKDTTFNWQNVPLELQKMGMQFERGVFTVQARTKIGQQMLWGALSVANFKNPQAILRMTDDPQNEGIRLHFKCKDDHVICEKVHGSCLGVSCALTKSEAKKSGTLCALKGRIAIDASRLSSFFSPIMKEKWAQFKLGKGYSWQGEILLYQDPEHRFQMTGEISGDEWDLLGYRFKKIRGAIDAHPNQILLSNVLVEDEAGTITIKKVQIEKKQHWELSIPLISIREWHPSSMRKIDTLPSLIKPFFIRNFTLSSIHADLEKPGSLEGHGKLTFTNQIKKESTLLDTPLEMIKNFGLDPGLLTPVQGEIDFDLRGDKLYLVALKESFSEGRRSEFYLAPGKDLSYIDLDGKMRINLKMRQDVTLKITEPFILTIRGTLENPRYSLDLLP